MDRNPTISLYVVTIDGLGAGELIWTDQADAEDYNREEHDGQGTILELEVELDWTKAVRVN